jgi:hypothetical protein
VGRRWGNWEFEAPPEKPPVGCKKALTVETALKGKVSSDCQKRD